MLKTLPTTELAMLVNEIVGMADDYYRDYLLLLLFTGLRRWEIADLRWSQINLNVGTIQLADSHIVVPLNDFAWKLLARRRTNSLRVEVFPRKLNASRRPKPLIDGAHGSCLSLGGIKFSLNGLRQTFIGSAEQQGICREIVGALTGLISDSAEEARSTLTIGDPRESSNMIASRIQSEGGLQWWQ